jgi:hypothetical protein
MAKGLTKTETKRAFQALLQKARKLWTNRSGFTSGYGGLTTAEFIYIEKIVNREMKKL